MENLEVLSRMIEQLDIQAIVDIAFVMLVMILTAKATARGKEETAQISGAWKEELKQLEAGVRDIVEEAGAAGRNLDRQLDRRKGELESLLYKLEDAESRLVDEIERPQPRAPKKRRPERSRSAARREEITEDYTPESYAQHAKDIEAALKRKKQQAKGARQKKRASEPKKAKAKAAALAKQIEVSRQEALKNSYNPTSITDEVALNIAKRLLSEGKEIDIVARKLDVPVSEIRMLDSFLRGKDAAEAKRHPQTNGQSRKRGFKRGVETVVELENEIIDNDGLEDLALEVEDYSFV